MSCILTCSFQQKRILIYQLIRDRELLDTKSQNHKSRKSEKHFSFYLKNAYFSTEIIKNFGQKRGAEEKAIAFLKEQKMGYLSMHLS